MHTNRCKVRFLAILITFLIASLPGAMGGAAPADTAKVLAGLQPSPGSPLELIQADPSLNGAHAMFSEMWRRFEERQLSHVRAWADRELPAVRRESPVLYYTFSGPDVVYATTFFPDCKTYVMCGLEPVGKVPDLLAVPSNRLDDAMRRLYGSLDTVLALGFFKTKDMGSDFRNPDLPGITPVLMTFLGRLGKNLQSVDLVALDREGNERPRGAAEAEGADGTTPGVKIVFDSGEGKPAQTVYYFSTNISNEGLEKNPGFANFCRKLEPGAGLVKAASYLMHTPPFSATRKFLMERCKFILQDDTGIPANVFAASKWQMHPYGRYVRPIKMFGGFYQRKLAEIHGAGDRVPLDFGIGYYYNIADCNILLASRAADSAVVAGGAAPGASTVASVAEEDLPPVVASPAPPAQQPEPSPTPHTVVAVTEPVLVPAAQPVVVAKNAVTTDNKTPRKSMVELEEEELRIRNDQSLTKKERSEKLRAIWKQQLAVMGKKAA